jgi:hypothetical protein
MILYIDKILVHFSNTDSPIINVNITQHLPLSYINELARSLASYFASFRSRATGVYNSVVNTTVNQVSSLHRLTQMRISGVRCVVNRSINWLSGKITHSYLSVKHSVRQVLDGMFKLPTFSFGVWAGASSDKEYKNIIPEDLQSKPSEFFRRRGYPVPPFYMVIFCIGCYLLRRSILRCYKFMLVLCKFFKHHQLIGPNTYAATGLSHPAADFHRLRRQFGTLRALIEYYIPHRRTVLHITNNHNYNLNSTPAHIGFQAPNFFGKPCYDVFLNNDMYSILQACNDNTCAANPLAVRNDINPLQNAQGNPIAFNQNEYLINGLHFYVGDYTRIKRIIHAPNNNVEIVFKPQVPILTIAGKIYVCTEQDKFDAFIRPFTRTQSIELPIQNIMAAYIRIADLNASESQLSYSQCVHQISRMNRGQSPEANHGVLQYAIAYYVLNYGRNFIFAKIKEKPPLIPLDF